MRLKLLLPAITGLVFGFAAPAWAQMGAGGGAGGGGIGTQQGGIGTQQGGIGTQQGGIGTQQGGGAGAGGSFSGGQSQGSFSGSQGQGQGSFGGQQGGARGGAGGGAGRGGTATQSPSTMNPFRATYFNPWSMGVSSGSAGRTSSTGTFGQPIYGAASTTGQTGQTNQSNAGRNNVGRNVDNSLTGFSTVGVRRALPYFTTLAPEIPFRPAQAPAKLHAQVASIIKESSFLTDNGKISVAVEEGVVVLRGGVSNQRQRRLAEAMVRMTPGVREVRNELQAPPVVAADE